MTKQQAESLFKFFFQKVFIWLLSDDWPFSPNASRVVWGLQSLPPATQLKTDLQYQSLQGSHQKKHIRIQPLMLNFCLKHVWSRFYALSEPKPLQCWCWCGRKSFRLAPNSPSSSKEGTPNLSSWSSVRGVVHFPMMSAVMDSAGISTGSIRLMRVWNRL